MSEPDSTPVEVTAAQKRKWLKDNGHAVGTRGKLSEQHERAYAEQLVFTPGAAPAAGQEALPGL